MMLDTRPVTRRKKRPKHLSLVQVLHRFARANDIRFLVFNDYKHVRMVGLDTTVDIWPTTGHYYVLETNYQEYDIVERQGERGDLPFDADALENFLATLFFVWDTL